MSSPFPLRWDADLDSLRRSYTVAEPFPHVVIDGFADGEVLRRIQREEFSDVGSRRWTYHRYYSQKTYSRTDVASFGPALRDLLGALAAPHTRALLSRLTGIQDLLFDDALEDGGLQATAPSGYLNLHVDPLVHPRKHRWRRRVNLILYLNEDWDHACGGDLELWDRDVRHCQARVAPVFNRAVVFAAGPHTVHGFPEPLDAPAGRARCCLAVYYFVEEDAQPKPHFGRMFARPGDGIGHLGVAVDNLLLHAYGRLGQKLGIDDRLVDRLFWALRLRR